MNKTATELQAMATISDLTLNRWADELRKKADEGIFAKMVTTITRTFDFGSFVIATQVLGDGRLVMKRMVSTAELAGPHVVTTGDPPEVRAEVTAQNIADIGAALRASLRRAGLPTCPHTLTMVPFSDLQDKVPEYSFLIDQLLKERGTLYAALERLEKNA